MFSDKIGSQKILGVALVSRSRRCNRKDGGRRAGLSGGPTVHRHPPPVPLRRPGRHDTLHTAYETNDPHRHVVNACRTPSWRGAVRCARLPTVRRERDARTAIARIAGESADIGGHSECKCIRSNRRSSVSVRRAAKIVTTIARNICRKRFLIYEKISKILLYCRQVYFCRFGQRLGES